jgi:hypothetical protein
MKYSSKRIEKEYRNLYKTGRRVKCGIDNRDWFLREIREKYFVSIDVF